VLFSSWLSAYTQAWQFYLGAFFILIVMTTPGGLASLIDRAWHLRDGDIDAGARCAWGLWLAGRCVRWPGSSWPPKWPIRPAWAAWPKQAQVPRLAVVGLAHRRACAFSVGDRGVVHGGGNSVLMAWHRHGRPR
jgi:branched-chain amino acid transport system permease protein